MTAPATNPQGFTKPPLLRFRFTATRAVVVILVAMGWITATHGRLHPAAVVIPPIMLALIAFATIYHVAMTHWVALWWTWLRRRRSVRLTPASPARNVVIDDVEIGVVSENETLITLVELHSDPLAPTVVTDTEERTVNVVSVGMLADVIKQVLDARILSADLVSSGHRATGGFADLYQQMTGPTPGPAERRSWIVLRMGLHDNLVPIGRRGGDAGAAQRLAAVTCLRVADTLASAGIDARPATAAAIDSVNALLGEHAPNVDHWSHLESTSSYTGVYYADPTHIATDAAQWWTWPQSVNVTTLVRITPGVRGSAPGIAALVRYRTEARPPAPPVSRLGPLYGVQSAVWQQFRVGSLPCKASHPSAPLAGTDPVLAFGPAGPLIGSIGDPRDHTSVHLPLAGAVIVLCQSPLLLRQVALRACVTGRPIVVITNNPRPWQSIVALAVSGDIRTTFPPSWNAPDNDFADEDAPVRVTNHFDLAPDTVLVIDTDQDWPEQLPQVTVLTDDEACDADIELVDADQQFGFTFKIRTGLSARVRSMPAHEERRILGVATQSGAGRGSAGVRQDPPQVRPPARPNGPQLAPLPTRGQQSAPPVRYPPRPTGADARQYSPPAHHEAGPQRRYPPPPPPRHSQRPGHGRPPVPRQSGSNPWNPPEPTTPRMPLPNAVPPQRDRLEPQPSPQVPPPTKFEREQES